jgi:CRISPR-associated protein Cas6/Cse3/CasE subtype I-E
MICYDELYQIFPRMSLYRLHKQLWKLFPGNPHPRPFLFRFDEVGERMLVCLRTTSRGEMKKQIHPHLLEVSKGVSVGNRHAFCVRVVPEIREGNRVVDTPRDERAAQWFSQQKAPQHGFKVTRIDTSLSQGRVFNGKRGRRITLNDTLIEGELEVTDIDRFESAMTDGIGRHKGFGFGLLQLAEQKRGEK